MDLIIVNGVRVELDMYKKFNIMAIVHRDTFGITYEPRELDVEIPDEWEKLKPEAGTAITGLMTHYLQVRWHEQYMSCVRKEQNAIFTMTLRLRTVEDVKSDIKHDSCCNDLEQLSANILKAHASLQEKRAKEDSPIILDERHAYEHNIKDPIFSSKGLKK